MAAMILLAGCDSEEAADAGKVDANEPPPMAFTVDSTLLAAATQFELPDGRTVELRPPAGWKPLTEAALALVARAADEAVASTQPADMETTPLAAYVAADQSALILSLVPISTGEDRIAALRAAFGPVRSDAFPIGGLTVDQYLLDTDGRRNLKVLVRPVEGSGATRQLQLDYVVAGNAFEKYARIMESSLGSLRQIKADQ